MLRGLVRVWLFFDVGFAKSECHGEAVGAVAVGLKAISGTESVFGRSVLLEADRGSRVPRALLRPLLSAVYFAFLPQRYMVKARVQAKPPTCCTDYVLFADAAPA